MIETARFRLMPCQPRHYDAFRRGREALAQAIEARLPEGWPEFPEAFESPLGPAPATPHWGGYLFIDPAAGTLVGNGGFQGPPDEDGLVEVGYEIAPGFRNRGYATEIVRALVDFAFADERVQVVQAHTLGAINASNHVLARLGMRKVDEFDDPAEGRLWCWQLCRADDGALTPRQRSGAPVRRASRR